MTSVARPAAPTLESVAALAGVSRATAGRVLSGSTTVNPTASLAVRTAAESLGYVTNHAARSLMTRRSEAVAFVVSETEERFFGDPFFATMLRGVHRVVAARNRQLMFIVVSTEADRRKLEQFAAGGHIDGAMFVSLHGPDPLPTRIRRFGVPVVLCGRAAIPEPDIPSVDADNVGGARLATRRVLDRGARCVVHLAGPADMVAGQDRLAGFRAELRGAGVRGRPYDGDGTGGDPVEHGDFSVESGRAAMTRLLRRFPEVDGVVSANDLMALGAISVLEAHGRRVPDDVAVVGFDDSELARAARPPLTTVHQPVEAMGSRLAELLIDAIDGAAGAGSVVVPTELVVRASA